MPELSIQQQLMQELDQRLKKLVFDDLSPDLLKAYVTEKAQEEMQRIVEHYEFRNHLSTAVSEAIYGQLPEIAIEVLKKPKMQALLRQAVEEGFQAGLVEMAKSVKEKTAALARRH